MKRYAQFQQKQRPPLPTDIVRREINSILFDALIDGIPRVNVEMNVRRKARNEREVAEAMARFDTGLLSVAGAR